MDSGIIFGNKLLDVVFISMFVAQFYKLVSTYFIKKRIVWSRLWETGGMPSSHSSSVIALTTSIAITEGMRSIAFAISVVFSIVVMFDAAGIRKAAGEHAGVINQLTDFFSTAFDKKFHNEKLKELLGHSRTEVLAGALLGFIIAILMKGYLLR
jgi:acid phosphatase family membrane protein YuiD